MAINDLNPASKRRVIKLYLDAFVRQKVPCPTCTHHCCTGCQSSHGYQPDTERWAQLKEKYGWTQTSFNVHHDWKNTSQGFFVAGKGCRLPYKERSATCVGFTCTAMNSEQRKVGATIYSAVYETEK